MLATVCSLDGGLALPCSSPTTLAGLGTGLHSFQVTVSNGAGASTAAHSWTIAAAGGPAPPAPQAPPPPPPATPPAPPAPSPPAPGPAASGKLAVARHSLAPKRLLAGGRATVQLLLGPVSSPERAAFSCRASVGRTVLRPLARKLQSAARTAAAACTWRLPKRSSGRVFRATIRIASGKTAAMRSVARRIH